MVADWTQEERDYLRVEVARSALRTPFRGGTVQDLAKQVGGCWRCPAYRVICCSCVAGEEGACGGSAAAPLQIERLAARLLVVGVIAPV
jgi:hypothetical protein